MQPRDGGSNNIFQQLSQVPAKLSGFLDDLGSCALPRKDSGEPVLRARAQVLLHVYDLLESVKRVNSVAQSMGGGVFHAAIEIVSGPYAGNEWSYGRQTGVCTNRAKCNPHHVYRETISLGWADVTALSLGVMLARLRVDWTGADYHLVRRNCITFCETLCAELEVAPVPNWVGRFGRICVSGLDAYEYSYETAAVAASTVRSTVSSSWTAPIGLA